MVSSFRHAVLSDFRVFVRFTLWQRKWQTLSYTTRFCFLLSQIATIVMLIGFLSILDYKLNRQTMSLGSQCETSRCLE